MAVSFSSQRTDECWLSFPRSANIHCVLMHTLLQDRSTILTMKASERSLVWGESETEDWDLGDNTVMLEWRGPRAHVGMGMTENQGRRK